MEDESEDRVAVTYYMNHLQNLATQKDYCVTLNRADEIDPDRAERARRAALDMLQQKSEDLDIREAGARLRRAAARVAVSHRLR